MLANIALTYRLVWTAAYFASRPSGLWIGTALIVFFYGVRVGVPTNALPYVALWFMLVFGLRFLLATILPFPSATPKSFVPKQKPMPKAVQAVVVTPDCAEDCPDEQTMIDRLPENVRQLIR